MVLGQALGSLLTQVRELDLIPGSWLYRGAAPAVAIIWRVNHKIRDIFVFLSLFLCFYLFIWKSDREERDRDKQVSETERYPPSSGLLLKWPDRSQELRTPFGFPAGWEASPTAFLRFAGSWMRSKAVGSWIGVPEGHCKWWLYLHQCKINTLTKRFTQYMWGLIANLFLLLDIILCRCVICLSTYLLKDILSCFLFWVNINYLLFLY